MASVTSRDDLARLESIQRRVLWLAALAVHHANTRPNSDGTKIGGHQASSTSVVSLMTALYFAALREGDVVATKAHASPVLYAIEYLRGRLTADDLRSLRVLGGLQAYPSRRKNPSIIDLSTGSMGLGAVTASFAALAGRYVSGRWGARSPKRFIAMVGDAGGHDLPSILEALDEAGDERSQPCVILAQTVKGWGLPLAADPMNHGALLSAAQMESLRESLGVPAGGEWDAFPASSPEGRLVAGRPMAFTKPPLHGADPEIPDRLDETYPAQASSQEAFGRVLGKLGRLPAGDHIVTLSADVAVTTHLAGWINRKGVWAPVARPDFFAETPQMMQWKESPAGQHVELGIAEHNLFLALGAFGLSRELSGVPLLPIGTLYDPFITRGLDALYHALYAGGKFIAVATPSGVSLSPEGGAHQSVITPGIGVALPAIAYYEPTFALEVEWILLHALASLLDRDHGESLYLRLSTKPVDQSLAPAPSREYRERVLRGGYRLVDARGESGWDAESNAVHLFAAGVMVPEAVEAARLLRAENIFASVFAVTSPDKLYRDLRGPRPYREDLVTPDEEDVPLVSVLV